VAFSLQWRSNIGQKFLRLSEPEGNFSRERSEWILPTNKGNVPKLFQGGGGPRRRHLGDELHPTQGCPRGLALSSALLHGGRRWALDTQRGEAIDLRAEEFNSCLIGPGESFPSCSPSLLSVDWQSGCLGVCVCVCVCVCVSSGAASAPPLLSRNVLTDGVLQTDSPTFAVKFPKLFFSSYSVSSSMKLHFFVFCLFFGGCSKRLRWWSLAVLLETVWHLFIFFIRLLRSASRCGEFVYMVYFLF